MQAYSGIPLPRTPLPFLPLFAPARQKANSPSRGNIQVSGIEAQR